MNIPAYTRRIDDNIMSNISNKQNLINKIRWHSISPAYQEDISIWKLELAQLESQELLEFVTECCEVLFIRDEE